LVLTKKLNDFAQNCAENMAKKNKMEGYSFEEIANILNKDMKAIYNTFFRIKEKIKKNIKIDD
jgi:DNA-directed RNA polymerase specialized sigma24 family protein